MGTGPGKRVCSRFSDAFQVDGATAAEQVSDLADALGRVSPSSQGLRESRGLCAGPLQGWRGAFKNLNIRRQLNLGRLGGNV